jgi:hypothetical protein
MSGLGSPSQAPTGGGGAAVVAVVGDAAVVGAGVVVVVVSIATAVVVGSTEVVVGPLVPVDSEATDDPSSSLRSTKMSTISKIAMIDPKMTSTRCCLESMVPKVRALVPTRAVS